MRELIPEPPLDLLQIARDEIMEGHVPLTIVSTTLQNADLETPSPPRTCRRCDTAHREIVVQSALLPVDPVSQPTQPR
jgi:hypothetical protein